jgi:predicted dehydrogenase
MYGALLMDYSHQPDLLYWWLREVPVRLYASGMTVSSLPLTADPNVVNLLVQYDAQRSAAIHLNYVQSPERAYCEVIGERGWVSFDMETGLLRHGSTADAAPTDRQFTVEWDHLFQAEHDSFIHAMHGDHDPESPPHAGLQSMRFIDAAIRSLRNGGPVHLSNGKRPEE